ncbi:centrosomal protein of 295 kDa isoform X4 [Syngnathus acus]|uniref:centrosomal protein of 295 kDa isoform X4 n=1 Tax=Syngnathus acus TaxID=161584 RepID=UPI0018860A7D|nr:centrosomal protein of 295 kDa isoform X4 [Syngnathus acus]
MARRLGKLRLSPNEEAQWIQEERGRRRKLRIQQVREQHKNFAFQTRQNVERRRQRELELLGQELREQWEQQQNEKLRTLQLLYEQTLQMVGQGQRMAKENEPDLLAITRREALNHAKAEERFQEALKELKSQKLKNSEMQSRTINARKKALQVEKERSTKVANLPPPPPNPILQAIEAGKSDVGKKSDVNAFAGTRHHMPPGVTVDRAADTQQVDAHEVAELAMKRHLDLQREEERKRAERTETARVRGKSALRKEQLALDHERLLVELEHMQHADMLRRRQQAFQIAPQIFQPPHRKQEMKEDFQRDMEVAFEDMYTRERRIQSDPISLLVPEPRPVIGADSQDPELDVTLDEGVTSERERSTEDAGLQENAHVENMRAAPRKALTNLLNRIRNQRSESSSCDGGIPVASRGSERDNKVIPERDAVVRPEGVSERLEAADREVSEEDVTIETGSLSSQPAQAPSSPQAANATIQPIPSDSQDGDSLTSKILEFETERKEREMELEREKQQQMAFLQELEEQKARLERLLLESQQQETPQAGVHDQEVYPHPETPEHTRRIRECQERLLEQNRIHQHSMDLARRRLEDYQRSLQNRHNGTTPPPPPPLHKPQISSDLSSQASAGPSMPPALPSSSLQPAESFESSNLLRHLLQDISDPDPLTRKVVPRVPSTTTESIPPKAVIRKVLPSKMVTRELLSPQVVTRAPVPPNAITTQPIPLQISPAESLPPQVVTRQLLPFKILTKESLQFKPVTREPLPQAVTAEPSHPQVVTKETLPPQPLPLKKVTRESFHPTPVIREVLSPQALTREAFTRQATEFLPSTSFPIQPIQTITQSHLPQFGSPAEQDQQRPQEFRNRQQEGKEELRQKQTESLELLRQQKETLRALINVDAQPQSEVATPEDAAQTRLGLLSSLLKVIEKSNGGSLTRPGHLQTEDDPSLHLPSTSETASLHAPARAAKPPVTRVRLGTMSEQHELSAIQEVETPVDTSLVTGPGDVFSAPQHTMDWSLREPYESPVTTVATLQTSSMSSSRRSTSSLYGEKQVMGSGTSPDTSEHSSYRHFSLYSEWESDSFGPAVPISGSFSDASGSPGESAHGRSDRECLSITTLSTGSYITSDPDTNAGKSPTLVATETSRLGPSSSLAASEPQAALHASPMSDVQRIVEQYARELSVSLSTGREDDDDEASGVTSPSPASHTSVVNRDQPILGQSSVYEDQDSFRPLIGQPGDQSSYLIAEQRHSIMERLLGQPSAHSSVIGQPPGPPLSARLDLTLSRIMEQISRESSQRRWRGQHEPSVAQLPSHTERSWLDERPESSMRPLVAELDLSSGQDSGSSGERTGLDLSTLTEATIPSHPSLPPEASHGASVPPGADSFHPLPSEVTNNETAPDPSAVFRDSSEGRLSSGELSVSTHSDSASQGGASESERSTDRFRTEEGSRRTSAWHRVNSPQMVRLSQSDASNNSSTLSILPEEDVEEEQREVEVPIPDIPAEECTLNSRLDLNARLQEAGSMNGILEQSQITLVSLTDTTLQDSIALEEEELPWEEEEQKGNEESQPTLMEKPPGALKADQSPTHAGMLLEFNWGSQQQGVFEKKRQALLERSARRAEQVKAKGALVRNGKAAEVGAQSEERPLQTQSAHRVEQIKAKRVPGKSGPAAEGSTQSKECPLQSRQQAKADKCKTATSTLVKQQKPLTPPVSTSTKLNEQSQVKKFAEMHRQTRRLYEQLEEVKERKAVQSRQEASASNRQKAKAFHMKTLQKLRAKQTQQ